MEIGTEISKKIRSAIKAKLIEQGAYVDDELPDYIMVMVANKKSQKQMTDDLSLFLGANTEKFTSWLHGLLKKLQSINSESAASSKHKTKDKHKGEKKKRKSSQGEKEKTSKEPEKVKAASSEDVGKRKSLEEARVVESEQVEQKQKLVEPEQPSAEINISENTDEFTEETKEIAKKEQLKSVSTGKPPPTKVTKPAKAPSVDVKKASAKSVSKEHHEHTSSKPKAASSTSKPKHEEQRESRKKPLSFVGSVKRKYEEEDEDEEYDPLNPAVGSVASVIHGPTRKSSVPKSLQANKSLLMKAVSEAEKSVSSKKKIVEHFTVESSRSGMKSDQKPPDLKHRLKTAAGLQLISRTKRKELQVARTSTDGAGDGPKKPRKSSESFENIKYTVKNEKVSPKQTKAPASAPSRVAAKALRGIGQMTSNVVVKEKQATPSDDESADDEQYGPPLPDMRLVQRTRPAEDEDDDDKSEDFVESSPQEDTERTKRGRRASPDKEPVDKNHNSVTAHNDPEIQLLLEEAHNTMLDLDDLNDQYLYADFKKKVGSSVMAVKEPRFIVTLDGVDPQSYTDLPENRPSPVQTVKPIPKKTEEPQKRVEAPVEAEQEPEQEQGNMKLLAPPMIKPFHISLKDTDDEDEGEVEEMDTSETETKSLQVPERCRYWPACANGNACQYVHPSIPCKTFPYCKFGDKCLYIHPNCKFDSQCTRVDCPYTHSGKRVAFAPTVIQKILQVPVQQYIQPRMPAPVMVPPTQTQCKFFPNCRNMNCPFIHPKPCRYGIGCMNKGSCSFYHPPLPGKEKLKWTSGEQKLNIDNKTALSASSTPAK